MAMSALTYRAIERRFLQRKVRIAWWSAAEAPKALGTTAITAPVVDNHDAAYLLQVLLSGPACACTERGCATEFRHTYQQ
jgi:hypothetical protein